MALSTEKRNCIIGRLALFVTTLIWGTSFVALKNTLDEIPTLYVLAYRFTGAAILMLLLGVRSVKKLDWQYVKGGTIIGICLFLAYVLQTYGLSYTTPSKNAFLTTTYCILTPFLFWIFGNKRPDKFNVIAAAICLVGVGFVSLEGDLSVNIGDVLTICCGLFFGLHIIATDRYVKGRSVVLLSMVEFAVAGALSWIFAGIFVPYPTEFSTLSIVRIAYLCIMCTGVCFTLQTFGQKHTPPSSVAVIMTLESVFGALISVVFYGEVLTAKLIIGFVLIFIAVIISETKLSFLRKKLGPKIQDAET